MSTNRRRTYNIDGGDDMGKYRYILVGSKVHDLEFNKSVTFTNLNINSYTANKDLDVILSTNNPHRYSNSDYNLSISIAEGTLWSEVASKIYDKYSSYSSLGSSTAYTLSSGTAINNNLPGGLFVTCEGKYYATAIYTYISRGSYSHEGEYGEVYKFTRKSYAFLAEVNISNNDLVVTNVIFNAHLILSDIISYYGDSLTISYNYYSRFYISKDITNSGKLIAVIATSSSSPSGVMYLIDTKNNSAQKFSDTIYTVNPFI